MIFIRTSILFLFLFFSQNIHAQTIYEWYQDSIVIFQIKTNDKLIISSENHQVDINQVKFVKDLKEKYGIFDFHHFFPDYSDEKLRKTYQLKFKKIELVDNLIEDLANLPFIEYAEKKERHVRFLTPNDLGANAANGTGMWHLYTMQAQQAWDLSTGNSNVIVAITDDAIKTDHPDLAGKTVPGNDATNQNSTDPRPCGGNNGNHGTHVAGTSGANTNNGIGVASIGWNISIMPVKIGRCSDGALTSGYEGVAWAANNGADVINMSWGGGGSSNFAQNIVNNATNQGAILVAAAGNDGNTSLFYPAAYNNVIAVASTTTDDSKSGFSQFGTWIDISAPGSAIRSTWANDGYNRIQGTSMASPNVSGLLGLMKSYAPNASNADLINCLYSSADPVTSNAGQMGAGRINAFQAMQCMSAFTFQLDAGITEIQSPALTVCGTEFTPQLTLRNFGANNITALPIIWEWNGTVNTFNWTGNLSSGQSDIITLPLQTAAGGNYTFSAVAGLPGDQNPANDSLGINFAVDPTGQEIDLTIITDCYGSEITWDIRDDQNNVVASGGPYANINGGETINSSYCLPVGCYTFNIEDSYGDGMYGSQWQNCAVNGNYFATGPNNTPLFEMTANNADFGNGSSHNFCLIDQSIQNDAGISQIISPSGIVCAGTVEPEVRIQNFGSDNLSSATILYNTGGANQSFNWTGNLSTGQSQVISLPPIATGGGIVNLTVSSSQPNGQTDDNPLNDDASVSITVYNNGIALPFTEDFESNSFGTNLWTLQNPDNNITWDLVTVAGNIPGDKAARMNFFNYSQSSQRDGLVSPLLDLNGYSGVQLDFEHAYRRFVVQGSNQPAPTDSLIIYISNDCGNSWQKIFSAGEDGTGSFATFTASNQEFSPTQIDQWCLEKVNVNGNLVGADCYSINLDAFISQEIFVKFEGFNAGTQGNNLFIDNINITGAPIPFDYDAGISEILNSESICGATFTPLIELSNYGNIELSNVGIAYELNGILDTFFWTGSLLAGQSIEVSLASQALLNGLNNFSASTFLPNGQNDENISNDGLSINIDATPLNEPNTSIPNQICQNTDEILSATPLSGGTIFWFDDSTSNTPVFNGNNYTINLPAGNYKYFAQEIADTAAQFVGLTDFQNGAFFQNTDRFLYFDVFEDIVLKSVKVNADDAGNRLIQLRDENGAVLQQVDINIPAGVSRVDLNFEIAPGTDYQLGLGGNNNGLWRTDDIANVSYPYEIPGLVSIKESDPGIDFNPTLPNQYYYSFYEWEVSKAYCESRKAAVDFEVENCITLSPPIADFEANDTIICAGNSISFTDLSTGNPNSWTWTFDGGTPSSSSDQNPTITYNSPGTYSLSLIVSNADGSDTLTENTFITVNENPEVEILGDQDFCLNESSVLTADVTGGAFVLNHQWKINGANTGGNTDTLSADQAGDYQVEIIDQNGCSAISPIFTVNPPVALSATVATTPSGCGLSNGTASVAVNGNTGSIGVIWNTNPPVLSDSISNLPFGNYTLTVVDSNSLCSISEAFSITNIDGPEIDSIIVEGASCSNGQVGSASAFVSGGTGNYTYLWGGGLPNQSIVNNLSPGNYSLTVEDSQNCLASQNFSIAAADTIELSVAALQNESCDGSADGAVEINVQGGSGIYTFEWDSNNLNTPNLENLAPGNYSLTVTDDENCTSTIDVTIGNGLQLKLGFVIDDQSANSGLSSIEADVFGGQEPYTFDWNNGTYSGPSIDSLSPGVYTVIVEDSLGCTAFDTIYIGTTSIAINNLLEKNISLYPNPVDQEIFISVNAPLENTYRVEIFNTLGKILQVKSYAGNAGVEQINLSKLASGVYYLKIQSGGDVKVWPFVKT